MKYYIKTFGCQQNVADSERISASFEARGMQPATDYSDANYVVINTCMVRHNPEERVYGLIQNLAKIKAKKYEQSEVFKIIVTGCMVGIAYRDKSGQFLAKIRERMPEVDEFMPIEEVGFDLEPVRIEKKHAWVPIANGCNNFCTYCVVPFTRGREISRPYNDIVEECKKLKNEGFTEITLLGQNVNSYGADIILGESNVQVLRDIDKTYFEKQSTDITEFELNGEKIQPVYVNHLGKQRIPTLFPYLLEEVTKLGFSFVHFMSSNPWDVSDELIEVMARYPSITRTMHLPVQSGDTNVLKRMNRWYTKQEYIDLTKKIKSKIPDMIFTTDIIVGFCGETDEEFENTVDLAKQVGFDRAYIAMYSPRPMTAATKTLKDDIPHAIKKKRWTLLENLINAKYQ
ncbi:radical SAM protein [Candidatus Roizmanbacteria bacterium]|nr:radical SAM protein [Candidatus Roizmanbacteria bacterium]